MTKAGCTGINGIAGKNFNQLDGSIFCIKRQTGYNFASKYL